MTKFITPAEVSGCLTTEDNSIPGARSISPASTSPGMG